MQKKTKTEAVMDILSFSTASSASESMVLNPVHSYQSAPAGARGSIVIPKKVFCCSVDKFYLKPAGGIQ